MYIIYKKHASRSDMYKYIYIYLYPSREASRGGDGVANKKLHLHPLLQSLKIFLKKKYFFLPPPKPPLLRRGEEGSFARIWGGPFQSLKIFFKKKNIFFIG